MSYTHHFQFTIGPVQGFVAQARRTRDFWAGSFILSWLTGVAMNATTQAGGKIIFPLPDQAFLDAIADKGNNKPTQGTLPNRFKAKVSADFDANAVITAVKNAWQALATVVYDAEIKAHANTQTKAIWDRQVANFFELSWAMVEQGNTLPVIDLRKNWRTHFAPSEAGHKCSLMEGWQELSGIEGFRKDDNDKRKAFWNKIRSQSGFGRDLVDNESLCAMAFIKRRFAHYFDKVDTKGAHGWELPTNHVPSVALLAALPTLEALDKAGYHHGENFAKLWTDCGGERGEQNSLPNSIRHNKALGLDGTAWFNNTYENPTSYGLKADKVKDAHKSLKALYKEAAVKEPSPFYAILMMDGDSLGKQMSNPTLQEKISTGLNTFTKGVKPIVDQHNGFLIYAGGDDVLAIMPLESALACAKSLRDSYIKSFDPSMTTSISAAVIFAHIKTPLSKVLHDAHHVLDDAAKDGAGRDAVAVQVVKQSDKHLLWAMPWVKALDGETLIVERLADQFRGKGTATENDIMAMEASTKFFYGIREHFTRLVDPKAEHNPDTTKLITDLLAVDYVQSGVNGVKDINLAKEKIAPLLTQCTPHKRTNEVAVSQLSSADITETDTPKIDGALLVRFLAFNGQELRGGAQ
ncbi:MAG: type III-B CRISPR-associated protein Cas10/Cmr2 [Proteobacteria bacterium]|nr:type III-B CRISPR-associated protein Cas10/Cmr2 [Pseudomonadota bacterium]